MKKVDLIIKNVRYFNAFLKKFILADVSVLDGRFYYIKPLDTDKSGEGILSELESDNIIDAEGKFMIPGLIDIHMHIESSMMTPIPFCNRMAECGVTTLIAEPHEIANVRGVEGIKEMIRAGEESVIDVFYGIPSSVPSTSPEIETTGAIIGYDEMLELMKLKNIACVGEIMNYRRIIEDDCDLEILKLIKYLRENHPNYIIEGHCPKLVGLDLAKFLYLGINGDHTEHDLEEIKQRFENGMFVELQDKMLRDEILSYIIENKLYEHMSFVTDDVMVDDLYRRGHLNETVRKAVAAGFPVEEAIYCATKTSANRMNLRDRGAIAPGMLADFSIHERVEDFKPQRVFKDGKEIVISEGLRHKFPEDFYKSIEIEHLTEDDFTLMSDMFVKSDKHTNEKENTVTARIMRIQDGSTHVKEEFAELKVENGEIIWEGTDYRLGVVFDRYESKNRGYALITGNGIKKGACATTWFHDHHNLFVMGADKKSMVAVANRIIDEQGGMATALNGEVNAILELPVCGILSEEPVEAAGQKLENVRAAMINQGYEHYNPIMSLGTLGLPVSPFLKVTDKGLVDVTKGEIVDLIV